jgi:hypothetical protein
MNNNEESIQNYLLRLGYRSLRLSYHLNLVLGVYLSILYDLLRGLATEIKDLPLADHRIFFRYRLVFHLCQALILNRKVWLALTSIKNQICEAYSNSLYFTKKHKKLRNEAYSKGL